MKFYVLGFMFDSSKSHVVLINKLRPEWQVGKLNGVGGHIESNESDESPVQAMVREFKEETGRDTNYYNWEHICTMSRYGDFECYVFRSFVSDLFNIKSITDEKVEIYPVSPLPPNVISNLPWLIPLCLDNNNYTVPYCVHAWVGGRD